MITIEHSTNDTQHQFESYHEKHNVTLPVVRIKIMVAD